MTDDQIERELTEYYQIILRHYKGITDDGQLQYWLNRLPQPDSVTGGRSAGTVRHPPRKTPAGPGLGGRFV